jgi:tRNA threonylcarbamoyl adenosine modification protein (Sua5/YciO/YrdC/YwlC family)
MKTEILTIDPAQGVGKDIARVAEALGEGALVVFPTETVYGLAANAANERAVERLRAVKGRAASQPFTVHIGRRDDVQRFVPEISPVGRRLITKGWPGPLTLIFQVDEPRRTAVYSSLPAIGVESIYREGSVGLRFPDDPVAVQLLSSVAAPVIASSANYSGRPPPLTAEDALADLDGQVDFVISAGRTRYGRASTIVSLNSKGYSISRAGVFDDRTIRRLAGYTILFVCTGNTCRSPIAEGLARDVLARRLSTTPDGLEDRGIFVLSAGTMAGSSTAAAPEAVAVCRARGIDISRHATQGLSRELISAADRIYAMTGQHQATILAIDPSAASKTELLDPSGDIADPLGGGQEDYTVCADRIASVLGQRLSEVPV